MPPIIPTLLYDSALILPRHTDVLRIHSGGHRRWGLTRESVSNEASFLGDYEAPPNVLPASEAASRAGMRDASPVLFSRVTPVCLSGLQVSSAGQIERLSSHILSILTQSIPRTPDPPRNPCR